MIFFSARKTGALSVIAATGLLFAASPGVALAKKKKGGGAAPQVIQACVANYKTGLEREQSSHLVEARELFLKCAKSGCGSPLKEECTTRFTRLDNDIPSIVPIVTDDSGMPRVDIEVRMDGQLLTSHLDGHALPLDPGMHEFSFASDGGVFATQSIMLAQGQRNRTVSASLRSAVMRTPKQKKGQAVAAVDKAPVEKSNEEAAPTPRVPTPEAAARQVVEKEAAEREASGPDATVETAAPSAGTSKLPYIVGGAGLASIGAGALFIYWGRKDNSNLTSCSPVGGETNCPQSAVDHVRRMYLIGDVALGVGVAALGAAYWLHASHPGKEEQGAQEAYRFDVAPTNSGAVATVSGSF
jgi:hypothetical protein